MTTQKQPSTSARPNFGPKNNKQRLILSLLFISIFIIFGPLLILYAKGWRINLQSNESEISWLPSNNIAALNLKTNPRTVNFSISNTNKEVIAENTTPWKTINLEPGLYNINLSKEGYFPLDLPIQLKQHQGLQPGFLNLIQKTYWEDLAIVPQNNSKDFTSILLGKESNDKCLLWQQSNDWRRYCNSEKVIGSFDSAKDLSGVYSENWYLLIDRTGKKLPQPVLSSEQIISFSKTNINNIYSLITKSDELYSAWYIRTNDADEVIEQQIIGSSKKIMYWNEELQSFISDNKLLRLAS